MPDTVQPGQLLDGRYLLIERFGHGGMSTVWRARDERLGRIVAVKMLATELLADPASRERLRTEAQSLARLHHPHIADVYDYGCEDVPFLAMELVDGVPLAQALSDGVSLPWIEAVSVAAQVAAALAAAHRRGIVHRDIAAGNILLTADGVKVIDFGICASEGNLEAGTLLGTPAYLAPERIVGQPVQPESDVYALGVLLHRMLSGGFPFLAETARDLMLAHRDQAPPRLPMVSGMPAVVAELCIACLVKDPADRPAAADVARSLFDLLGGAVTVPVPAQRTDGDAMATHLLPWLENRPATTPPPLHSVRKRISRRVRTTVAAAGVLLAGGAVWTVNGWSTIPPASPPAAAGPGPARTPVCSVIYQSTRDTGGTFSAVLTVVNVSDTDLTGARLVFDLPEGQRLATHDVWLQDGRTVSTVPGLLSLPPEHGVRLPLEGTYAGSHVYPLTFHLDDEPCAISVVGPTGEPLIELSPLPSHGPVVIVDVSPPAPGTTGPGATPGPASPEPSTLPSKEPQPSPTPAPTGGPVVIPSPDPTSARPSPTRPSPPWPTRSARSGGGPVPLDIY